MFKGILGGSKDGGSVKGVHLDLLVDGLSRPDVSQFQKTKWEDEKLTPAAAASLAKFHTHDVYRDLPNRPEPIGDEKLMTGVVLVKFDGNVRKPIRKVGVVVRGYYYFNPVMKQVHVKPRFGATDAVVYEPSGGASRANILSKTVACVLAQREDATSRGISYSDKSHIYKFEFPFPGEGLPSSFNYYRHNVYYLIEPFIVVDDGGHVHVERTAAMPVLYRMRLPTLLLSLRKEYPSTTSSLALPLQFVRTYKIGRSGNIAIAARLDRNVYTMGSDVPITFDITNDTNTTLDRIVFRLELTGRKRKPTIALSQVMQTTIGPYLTLSKCRVRFRLPSHLRNINDTDRFPIPTNFSLFDHTTFMYRMIVSVRSMSHVLKLSFPLVLVEPGQSDELAGCIEQETRFSATTQQREMQTLMTADGEMKYVYNDMSIDPKSALAELKSSPIYPQPLARSTHVMSLYGLPVLETGERLVCEHMPTGLYDREIKTNFERGRLVVTTRRVIWTDPQNSRQTLHLDLKRIIGVTVKLGLTKYTHPKVTLTIRPKDVTEQEASAVISTFSSRSPSPSLYQQATGGGQRRSLPPVVQTAEESSASPPTFPSSWPYIKISFKDGQGHEEFVDVLRYLLHFSDNAQPSATDGGARDDADSGSAEKDVGARTVADGPQRPPPLEVGGVIGVGEQGNDQPRLTDDLLKKHDDDIETTEKSVEMVGEEGGGGYFHSSKGQPSLTKFSVELDHNADGGLCDVDDDDDGDDGTDVLDRVGSQIAATGEDAVVEEKDDAVVQSSVTSPNGSAAATNATTTPAATPAVVVAPYEHLVCGSAAAAPLAKQQSMIRSGQLSIFWNGYQAVMNDQWRRWALQPAPTSSVAGTHPIPVFGAPFNLRVELAAPQPNRTCHVHKVELIALPVEDDGRVSYSKAIVYEKELTVANTGEQALCPDWVGHLLSTHHNGIFVFVVTVQGTKGVVVDDDGASEQENKKAVEWWQRMEILFKCRLAA
eukprot:TRINITY_DN963_c0_g1_i2.p1 TRINITY_DN963_c0_g1~~TRINITY_DN963_c0_g1_i2.p1  ORF type:complete len:1053 (+),score=230.28 TRINITY_DN963_c0_g1_i2:181-3159(+)